MTGGPAATGQDPMHALYAAHQVHTLAHMVFRHLSAGTPAGPQWTAPMGAPNPPAPAPATPAPCFYWYP
jgi:hypothetical protein